VEAPGIENELGRKAGTIPWPIEPRLVGAAETGTKSMSTTQFVRAGITHRVAFECKYWKRAVDRDAMLAFHSKLADIGNINGVMVRHAGFQRGTREYAARYGIDIRTLEDLPTFRETLAMRVASVCMPDPLKRPEPFWVCRQRTAPTMLSPIRSATELRFPFYFKARCGGSQTSAMGEGPHGHRAAPGVFALPCPGGAAAK